MRKKKISEIIKQLPCCVGELVYGVKCVCPLDKPDGDNAMITYNCRNISRQCSKCVYSELSLESFICTEIRIERNNRIVVFGNHGEKYLAEFVFTRLPGSKKAKEKIQPKFIADYLEEHYDRTGNVAK